MTATKSTDASYQQPQSIILNRHRLPEFSNNSAAAVNKISGFEMSVLARNGIGSFYIPSGICVCIILRKYITKDLLFLLRPLKCDKVENVANVTQNTV